MPPFTPGTNVGSQPEVYVSLIAAGSPDDFTPGRLDEIASVLSSQSGVPASSVSLTPVSSSQGTLIQASLAVPSAAEASAITGALAAALATPPQASALFGNVTGGLDVITFPVVAASERSVALIAASGSSDTGAIAAGLAVAIVLVAAAAFEARRRRASKAEPMLRTYRPEDALGGERSGVMKRISQGHFLAPSSRGISSMGPSRLDVLGRFGSSVPNFSAGPPDAKPLASAKAPEAAREALNAGKDENRMISEHL